MGNVASVLQLVFAHGTPAGQQIELSVLPHVALVIFIFWDPGQLRAADWFSQTILTLLICIYIYFFKLYILHI